MASIVSFFQEARIRMKLNELTEDQDEAAKAKDFNRAQQLLEECNKLKDELKALAAPPPPAPVERPVTQDTRTEVRSLCELLIFECTDCAFRKR